MDRDQAADPPKRKLIEVALPLEAINKASAREKSLRKGHPSTLHLWWARRPLAAARAVLFAQLVDDPSSHPDRFPTEPAQRAERERLHKLIEQLVVWENTHDETLFQAARREILNSTDGELPTIVDPFAGGGSIPLEAQRLGLPAHANDLNPLPVLMNTVLIELTGRIAIDTPITGGLASSHPADALAEDLRYFATLLEEKAEEQVGRHYPQAADGSDPLVYFWCRTVECSNPACQAEIPLAGSWRLSDKKGSEAHLTPEFLPDSKKFDFSVVNEPGGAVGTMSRTGCTCPACDSGSSLDYIKREGVAGRLGTRLLALQMRQGKARAFVPADAAQRRAASEVAEPKAPFLDLDLSTHSQYMAPPRYGLTQFRDLFSSRQLATLVAFVVALDEVQGAARRMAIEAGVPDDDVAYADGGKGARAYAEAIRILLALGIGRLVNRQSTLCIWNAVGTKVEQVFARQAYSMTWLFAEANPFAGASGSFSGQIDFLAKSLKAIASGNGIVSQGPAQDLNLQPGVVVSTDPPYYDNVPYADLADFFVVWHRRMLQHTLPIFHTVLSPKADELVADSVRLGGKEAAKQFFEDGFETVFTRLAQVHSADAPLTVYYAFRQSDISLDGKASTGWETVLAALIRAGWVIDGTWPMRTEQAGGLRSLGRNALASSVVVVCRQRGDDFGTTDRRGLIEALQAELPDALRKLQQGAIAPVDLPQAAIGPGMAVFSRYSKVIENDGSAMTVRSALARINEILDQVLNEQEGDFDPTTRFAIAWYRQHGYDTGQFGDADNMARARNTSVEAMGRDGILTSPAGKVTLLAPEAMPDNYDPTADDRVSAWEVLHHLIAFLERGGIPEAGALLAQAEERPDAAIDPELVKELAFLLFSIAEKNGWTKDALAFNTIATAWPDIVAASRTAEPAGVQGALDLEEG